MHICITFSSSYYKYIYSSDIPKYYYIFIFELLKRNKIIKFQNEIILLNWCKF